MGFEVKLGGEIVGVMVNGYGIELGVGEIYKGDIEIYRCDRWSWKIWE